MESVYYGIEKIQVDSKKSINLFESFFVISNEFIDFLESIWIFSIIGNPIIYGKFIFFNLLTTFRYYYYAEYGFDFFNVVNFFQIFVMLRSTEILIVSNFWLGVYT